MSFDSHQDIQEEAYFFYRYAVMSGLGGSGREQHKEAVSELNPLQFMHKLYSEEANRLSSLQNRMPARCTTGKTYAIIESRQVDIPEYLKLKQMIQRKEVLNSVKAKRQNIPQAYYQFNQSGADNRLITRV